MLKEQLVNVLFDKTNFSAIVRRCTSLSLSLLFSMTKLLNLKETMSTTMHLFTFYLESDGMSTNNDYKHFFGALSLQFC
jgi:hypothetical protein